MSSWKSHFVGAIVGLTCVLISSGLSSQCVDNLLGNPSFEGKPSVGGSGEISTGLEKWHDCSVYQFPEATPYDVHSSETEFWNVRREPADGTTFISLVVRPNRSWESIGTRLNAPLQKGLSYRLRIYLARNPKFNSLASGSMKPQSFTTPSVLRVWGAHNLARPGQLLVQTGEIVNSDWAEFTLDFIPKKDFNCLILEAYYSEDNASYPGHILLDNACLLKMAEE
jgi:hypothetical protein